MGAGPGPCNSGASKGYEEVIPILVWLYLQTADCLDFLKKEDRALNGVKPGNYVLFIYFSSFIKKNLIIRSMSLQTLT